MKGRAALRLAVALTCILGACEAATPSAPPTNNLPDITPAPLATAPRATPRPTTCPTDGDAARALQAVMELQGPISRHEVDVHVLSVTRSGDGGSVYESPDDPGSWDADWVVGGAPLAVTFEIQPMSPRGFVLTELSATYNPPGDATWAPVEIERIEGGDAFTVPDASGAAQLRFVARWTDGCFDYRGSVRFAFDVIPAAVVAACPSDTESLEAILRAHADDQVVIGGVARPIGTLMYEARYTLFNAADQVGQFGGWDPGAPEVEAATGESLAIDDDDPDLELSGGDATFYRRPDPSSTSVDDLVDVGGGQIEVDGSGHLQVVAPDERGHYVLQLSTSWELQCLTGGGLAYFNLDVSPVVGSLPRPSV